MISYEFAMISLLIILLWECFAIPYYFLTGGEEKNYWKDEKDED